MIQLINAPTLDGSGLTVSIDPYDTGIQTSDYGTVSDSSKTIDAGKYRVKVYNEGLTDITVNGDTVPAGNEFLLEAFNNDNTQKTDLTPEVVIVVPSGGNASWSWVGPSA